MFLLTMHAKLFLLSCLACASHARKVQHKLLQGQNDVHASVLPNSEKYDIGRRNQASLLSELLMAFNVQHALNPARQSMRAPSVIGPVTFKSRQTVAPPRMMSADFDEYRLQDVSQRLAMRDDVVGTGDEAKEDDIVSIKYRGRTMANDREFDAGGVSFKLGAGQVILGWDKGLVGMRVGGKRTLRIPSRFGYGVEGFGADVPPGADLEFECELVQVGSGGDDVRTKLTSPGFVVPTVIFLLVIVLLQFVEQ